MRMKAVEAFINETLAIIIQMLSVLTTSTATGKDIHVASTDVEATAVIKKNSCDQDRQQGCKSEVYKYVV